MWVERSAELAQVPPFSQGKVEQGLVRWQTKPWKLAVQVQVKLERSTLLVQVAPLSTDVHGSYGRRWIFNYGRQKKLTLT